MDWITDNIAIGNFLDAAQASTDGIDAFLCLKEGCCDESNDRFHVVCIPLLDGAGNNKNSIDAFRASGIHQILWLHRLASIGLDWPTRSETQASIPESAGKVSLLRAGGAGIRVGENVPVLTEQPQV